MIQRSFIIFFFFSLCIHTGCLSLNDYAIKYQASGAFHESEEENKQGELHQPTEPCHYLRNQLVVASQEAQTHIWWVWAFPGYWPLHILTLYILPIDETRIAHKVIDAAQQMERAYQKSDAAFFETCEQLMNEPELGTAFAQENPFLEDN